MKNKIFLLLVIQLLFAASCSKSDYDTSDSEPDTGGTYVGLSSTQIILPPTVTGDEVESITLESLRIIIFSKASGKVVTNEKFDISDLSLAQKIDDKWIVNFENIVVATKPGPSIVYVVLNENIMSISQQTLTGSLNMISTLAEMEDLVNTPLNYTNPLRVQYGVDGKPIEPPFIMSTFDEFDIEAEKTITNPYIADLSGPSEGLKGFELDRTMAKVTLDSVSSYPRYVGDITNNIQTSFIFILKMGLVNVPTQYMWSPNRVQTTPPDPNPYPNPVPPYSGTFQTLDFGLENTITGYYDRTWNGSISAKVTAKVVWRQYGTGDIYKVAKNNGVNSYGTNIAQAVPYAAGDPPDVNHGNFVNFLELYFANGGGAGFDLGNITYSNPVVTPVIVGDYWVLNEKNISYYVPEHILTDKTSPTDATKLYVKASIASMPDFDPSNVSYTQSDIVWDGGGASNTPQWTFPLDINNIIDDAYHEVQIGSSSNYMHVWSGTDFYREASGTIEVDLSNADFVHITDGNIKDFYLPIRTTSTDYNIYRNHEYKFSVHALEQWASMFNTLSKSSTVSQDGKTFMIQFKDNK